MEKVILIMLLFVLTVALTVLIIALKKLRCPRYIKGLDFFRMVNGGSFLMTVGKEPIKYDNHYTTAEAMFVSIGEEL